MGRKPADLMIHDGQMGLRPIGRDPCRIRMWRSSREGLPLWGRMRPHHRGRQTQIIEAKDATWFPGLLDAHMHVESGMVTVTEFVRAVAPRGTTGMFIDPHEMANVFGLRGVRLDGERSRNTTDPCLGANAILRAVRAGV